MGNPSHQYNFCTLNSVMPLTFMTCSLLFYVAVVSESFSGDFSNFSHFPTPRASPVVQLICYKFSWIIGHLPDILPVPCYILFPAIMGKEHGTFHLCSAWFSWWSLLPFISLFSSFWCTGGRDIGKGKWSPSSQESGKLSSFASISKSPKIF